MDKSQQIVHDESKGIQPWGTWEELLLACAVNRYGSNCWDSVAGELQKRSSKTTPFLLTACNCKQKYHDLKRRYTDRNDAVSSDDVEQIEAVPWLHELRKLRINELKRQLQHYDLSIMSLQSKVKKLKEEKEESAKGCEIVAVEGTMCKEPANLLTEPVFADELDRDNRSVTQSNTTAPKSYEVIIVGVGVETGYPEKVGTGDEKDGPVMEPFENMEPVIGPVREESCNGSSDSIAKETVKVEMEGGASESPELRESVAESKDSGGKEGSDVQSSANKLKKEESDGGLPCRISGEEERETEDRSPAMNIGFVKSQPMVDFLEILLSHKLGSVFERLLESQYTATYRNLIRQHMDLKSVKRNVEEGWYVDCEHKFFRDLLLLVNNVMLFFGSKSSEFLAAAELRQLISNKMAQKNDKADWWAGRPTSPLSQLSLQPKQVQKPCDSLLLKPHIAGLISVCRKRRSNAKGSASSSGSELKREQAPTLGEEDKPVVAFKQISKPSAIGESNPLITKKKRTRDGSASSSRSSNKNGKILGNSNYDNNFVTLSNQGKGIVGSPPLEHSESKNEKTPVTAEKKRSAANFLVRLKRTSSPSSAPPILDASKSSTSNFQGIGIIPGQKRDRNIRDDEKEGKFTKRSSRGRQPKEESSPIKRKLGRPKKRIGRQPKIAPTPTLAETRKRTRGESAGEASQHSKKRSRNCWQYLYDMN